MLFPDLPAADHDRAREHLGNAMALMRNVAPDGSMEAIIADLDDWALETALALDAPYSSQLGWRPPTAAPDERIRFIFCPARMAVHMTRLEDELGDGVVERYLDAVEEYLALHLFYWRRWPDETDEQRELTVRNMLGKTLTDGPGSPSYLAILGDFEIRS